MICLYLKITGDIMRLIFQVRFWFMHTFSLFLTPALADSFPLESPHVSGTPLSILADLNNIVV